MNQRSIAAMADAISFRQLRLFESVGRLSSIRQGSEECNLSQPAVTQAIRKLERAIGDTLFERRASGSYLTPIGEMLFARTRSFIDIVEAAIEKMRPGNSSAEASVIAQRLTRSQARTLAAVIEAGTFAAGATRLGLSLVSLQRAARDLDNNVYRSIFYRTADGLMVTSQGLLLGRQLKLAAQEIEWALREIDASRGRATSLITIGALPFGGSLLLATVLDQFITDHPNADVRIVTEGASEMIQRLRAGEVDMVLGLVQEVAGNDLDSEVLAETPYRIVVRSGHSLARKARVEIHDLIERDWIVGTEGSNRRQCFDSLFQGHQAPHAPIATSSLPIIRHLLKSSDRLALITDYELVYEGDAFKALKLDGIGMSPVIGVTMRKGWKPTAVHCDFVELLRRKVTKPQRGGAPVHVLA